MINLEQLKTLSKVEDKDLDKHIGYVANMIINEKKKLTNWKKEPSIVELKNDLSQAEQSHSCFVAKLAKWEKLYDPAPYGDKKHCGSRVVPKLVRKQGEWRIASLTEPFLGTNNLYEVKGLTHDDVVKAKQNAMVLNHQFNTQLNKVKLVDNIIRQLVKVGTSIVRVGWETETDEVLEDVEQFEYMEIPEPVIDPMYQQIQMQAQEMGQELPPNPEIERYQQIQQQYQQLAELRVTEPDSYEQQDSALKAGLEMSEEKGSLYIARSLGFKKEKVMKQVVNRPSVQLCDLRNVYIDPTCRGNLDKAQFIIHSYEASINDLKRSGLYQNLDELVDVTFNTSDVYHSSKDSNFKFADKARKKLVVYEYWGYWDIHGNNTTTPIIATWVNNTLIRLEENPFPDKKLPFVIFNYIPEEDDVYGIPDGELLEDNQAILGAVTRGVIDLLGKSANSQTGYSKNFLDPTNKIRFRKGEDYEFNPNMHPTNAIHVHKYPEVPQSAMTVIQMMNNEAEAISGVKAFSGTGITSAYLGDTAAGARGVLDAVSKREMSILRRISDGFISLGYKIISMNGAFLSEKEVVRITNKEFITVRRDDLIGKFDLSLTISTAEADDAKAKELAFMLQTLGNNLPPEVTNMMIAEIMTLRKMPDVAHKILNFKPEPDPVQQQMQELQIQKLQAEIELLKSEAQENLAKSQVQEAKVGTEQAKAQNLQSDADNKTLDFIERDSGAKHQQELDKLSMNNEHKLKAEELKANAKSAQNIDKHNSDLLKIMANNDFKGMQEDMVNQGLV